MGYGINLYRHVRTSQGKIPLVSFKEIILRHRSP
jgi:hypothetical protein